MYFEIDTHVRENEELSMLKAELHKFAKEVIRPAAKELDQMPPGETAREGSPYYEVMRQMKKNGYHRIMVPEEFGGMYSGPEMFNVVFEEIAWGSLGFATALGVDIIPTAVMSLIGSPEVIDEVLRPWMEDEAGNYHGCWSVMDPDRGSDYIMSMSMPDAEKLGIKGFARADRDGDGWLINGVKSYWTSSAPCANWILTHPLIPPHHSPTDIGAAIVPTSLPGVTVSPPIDKLGTRDDPQGEIVFDNVRIPEHYMISSNAALASNMMKMVISSTSCGIASMAVGVARAAFEEALSYTQERVQGGKAIIDHQLTRYRLYKMFEKIETARYFIRSVTKHVFEEIFVKREFLQSTAHALAAQAYSKEKAFEVVTDALQLFGGAGITKDYVIEKIFRDARCGLIEDGTVEILGLEALEDMLQEETYNLD